MDEFPVGVRRVLGGCEICLRAIPSDEFIDPFCDATVMRHEARSPGRLQMMTNEQLMDFAAARVTPAPAGMLFHTARCGSTLVANALKCVKDVLVYSEPSFLNGLLYPPLKWKRSETVGLLRVFCKMLASHAKKSIVLKMRSWNTIFIEYFIAAFPETPWLFLAREPIEVAVSVLRKPPTWLRSYGTKGNPFLAFTDNAQSCREEYIAQILRRFLDTVTSLRSGRGIAVDYSDLPEAITTRILDHFAISPSVAEAMSMETTFQWYSKAFPAEMRSFRPDGPAKRAAASSNLVEALSRLTQPSYQSLLLSSLRHQS